MKLLIVSNMEHYRTAEGVVGHGSTAREIGYLATLFDRVDHLACLHPGEPTALMGAYRGGNVHFVFVPPAGGARLIDKLKIVYRIPQYLAAILRELPKADVVHVRAPANISLLAILLLAAIRKPRRRWIKYAGNWRPSGPEAWSYTIQRWLLDRGLTGGVVTVNGEWDRQPAHVHSFLNPCLTDEEVAAGRAHAEGKRMSAPVRIVFVGRLDEAKGIPRIIGVARRLRDRGVPVEIELIGDGPARGGYEAEVRASGLDEAIAFRGWMPRPELNAVYARSHLMLFPTTSSEGWPKVLSEAMAYGVVPVTSDISSLPHYLRKFECGRTLDANDLDGFAAAIAEYANDPARWEAEARRAADAAERFSYRNYLQAVRRILELP